LPKSLTRRVWRYQISSRTDNTMANRKRKQEQTTIYKTLYRKLKIEQHEPH
jgi:hypothetical protein